MSDRPDVLRWGAAGVDEQEEGGAEAEAAADSGEVGLGERDAGAEGAVQGEQAAGGGVPGPGDPGDAPVEVQPAEAHRVEPVSVQDFHDAGLLWFANRALHPFGFALMVQAEVDGGTVVVNEDQGLRACRTTDPAGFVFSVAEEDAARLRFFAWMAERARRERG